jgi:hypothetical protein
MGFFFVFILIFIPLCFLVFDLVFFCFSSYKCVIFSPSFFYRKPLEFALHLFDFYICSNCSGPMYGGHHVCLAAGDAAGDDNANKASRRLCPTCRNLSDITGCRYHGGYSHLSLSKFCSFKLTADRTIFKCRFCCSIATYFCGGLCHYCDICHAKAGELTEL